MSHTVKAATHRKAIEEAAKINNPATIMSAKNSKQLPTAIVAKSGPAVVQQKPPSAPQGGTSDLSSISFTTGGAGDPMNDDYEGNKVNKSKKTVHDADIQAVQDLDRWG